MSCSFRVLLSYLRGREARRLSTPSDLCERRFAVLVVESLLGHYASVNKKPFSPTLLHSGGIRNCSIRRETVLGIKEDCSLSLASTSGE